MRLEDAMKYLRLGNRICRQGERDRGTLCCTVDEHQEISKVLGSFYMSVYDIMASDWEVVDD